MDLRSKKRIINTRQLPGFVNGYPPVGSGADQLLKIPDLKDPRMEDWRTNPMNYQLSSQFQLPNAKPLGGALSNLEQGRGVNGEDFTKLKPKTSLKDIAQGAANVVNKASEYLGDAVGTYSAFKAAFAPTKGVEEYLQDAGTVDSGINGIGYTRQRGIDTAAEMKEVEAQNQSNTANAAMSGASLGGKIGSNFGPIGSAIGTVGGGLIGAITGIFGGKKRKREAQRRLIEAQIKGINTNEDRESVALTEFMQQDYARRHGNPQAQYLYGAALGKDVGGYLNRLQNIYDVYTSEGVQKGQPNAIVAKDESILDNIDNLEQATGALVRTGKKGVDTELANLGENTIVLGGQKDWRTGISFRDQAIPYTHALEIINKRYGSRKGKYNSSLALSTSKLQQEQVNKLKQPIVEKLQDLAQQQQYQHQVEGYNEQYMVKGGKDRRRELGDTRSDTTRKGYNENGLKGPLERGYDINPIPAIMTLGALGGGLGMTASAVEALAAAAPAGIIGGSGAADLIINQMLPAVGIAAAGDAVERRNKNLNKFTQFRKNKGVINQIKADGGLPGYESGKPSAWDSIIPNSIGMLAGLGQYWDADSQDIYRPYTYARNTYAGQALPVLAGLRSNPYEQAQQIRDAERYQDYGISQSGGLNVGQKMAMKLANNYGAMKNIATAFDKSRQQDNAYLSDYAKEALRYGAVDADNRMKANQFDEEMFAQAHAAKLQGKQMGMLNFMKFLEQYSKDNAQRKQFNSMYDLYVQDRKLDKEKLNAYINSLDQNRQVQPVNKEYKLSLYPQLERGGYQFPWFASLAGSMYDYDKLIPVPKLTKPSITYNKIR